MTPLGPPPRHPVGASHLRQPHLALSLAIQAELDHWSTPGLVETRFSPDALVWVVVVFHGTAAWRNHGLIIFPLLFYRTSVQLRCPAARLVGGLRPPGPR